jgi:hypothetical protein
MIVTSSSDDVFDRAVDVVWFTSWPIATLWALVIVGYQVFYWLKNGMWLELPIVSVFHHFGFRLEAVYEPQSWIGLARVFEWFLEWPLSIVGALLILFCAWSLRTFVRDS